MEFYERLTAARKAKGFSQEDLAAKLDISRQAVSKWENGTAQPEMSNIIKLCEALEITPNELFGYESVPEEPLKKSESPETKRIRAIIIIFVIAAASLVNIVFIKAILPERTEPQIEYIISEFTAGSFNWEFIQNVGRNKQLSASYSPSISGSDCVFSITLAYDGKSFSVPAEYSNGTCTAVIAIPYYTKVTVTACMEQGGYTYTYPLGIFTDARESGMTFYPVE
ncbi:MAG: helix-turn-helix transcriptional regulator [Oscillospiraceae bacterium]|nr:helix-turn-helix transcriptional regulator [Oscillospiraceae bacterium]